MAGREFQWGMSLVGLPIASMPARQRQSAPPGPSPFEAALAARHVHMVGRYGRWEYASIEDALLQGVETAEAVCAPR